jgi:hypothetical protein
MQLHNHTLESVSSAKYLGINLQSSLKWTQHTNNIVANANKNLGFLKRNLKTSNTKDCAFVWKESHQPVTFPSCGSIKQFKVFLGEFRTITISYLPFRTIVKIILETLKPPTQI